MQKYLFNSQSVIRYTQLKQKKSQQRFYLFIMGLFSQTRETRENNSGETGLNIVEQKTSVTSKKNNGLQTHSTTKKCDCPQSHSSKCNCPQTSTKPKEIDIDFILKNIHSKAPSDYIRGIVCAEIAKNPDKCANEIITYIRERI